MSLHTLLRVQRARIAMACAGGIGIVGFHGLSVWWTAQVARQQPADRAGAERAGSYDRDAKLVSAPRPPPSTIN